MDYVTIPDACIETLAHAFKLDYVLKKHNKPLDVVLVAGYNDLVENYGRDFIIAGYQEFSKMVLQQGSLLHPEQPNTVAIATLMYPPQLAWFPDNGQEPPQYENRMEKIKWLNEAIKLLNIANGSPFFPNFHTYGVRTATRRHRDVYGQEHHRHIKAHRWEHWLQTDPARMLHLTNDRRYKMGKAINTYFILRTG